jgi:dihydropteroate synthase
MTISPEELTIQIAIQPIESTPPGPQDKNSEKERIILLPVIEGIPADRIFEVLLAEQFYKRAGAAQAAGDDATADELRRRADDIFERIEAKL